LTAYLLALAMFIPMSGWLADRFGARPVFASAIGLFTVSSVLCGLSNGLWEFTAARILQGLGGAMMVPVGRLVVLRTTAKQNLLRSIAYITWPGLAAPILGPPVGGFITTYASWRWIFLLNVPLGLLGVVLAHRLIPNSGSSQKRPFDWTSLNTVGFADIHQSQLSDASTLSSMIQQMTFGMGIAVGAIALRLASALHSTNAGSLTAADFRIAFLLIGVIALVAVIDYFSLPANAGAEVSGHPFNHSPLRADSARLLIPLSRPSNGSSSDKGARPVVSKRGGSVTTLKVWPDFQGGCDHSRGIQWNDEYESWASAVNLAQTGSGTRYVLEEGSPLFSRKRCRTEGAEDTEGGNS
jgi:MFS family permease